ncbi:MAG TPA: hypothetical protein VG167_17935 [Verrucomicrobiae bacterium]|nr:hypothetical protein [Verrucomicrobiae bacterium]
MKSILVILAALTGSAVWGGHANFTETGLPPGLVFNPGTEPLTGQLVFLYLSNAWALERPLAQRKAPATVCSIDLCAKRVRLVVETPPVFTCALFAAPDGAALCVEYCDSLTRDAFASYGPATNALLYFEPKRLQRIVHLPAVPDERLFVGSNVFFKVHVGDPANYATRIVRCDPENTVTLEDSAGAPNWSSFEYRKRSDGQYVFFADRFRSEWNDPDSGRNLVVSPWTASWARIEDPRGKRLKRLARFRRRVLLDYMSPCHRYALMRRSAPAKGKVGELGGGVSTYYLIDLFTGKYRVLIEDAVANETHNYISYMVWVGEPPSTVSNN